MTDKAFACGAVAASATLSVIGFVLAATVAPAAINMAVGTGLAAVLIAVLAVVAWLVDR